METGYVVDRITDGLLDLMQEKPFEEITVSDIVQRAEVGRASFYRHFDSKEAVMRHHMARLLKEWGREFEAIGKLEELGPSLLRHFYGHRNFYLLLHRCGMSHYLLEAIRNAMELDNKSDEDVYPLSCFAGGLYGLVDEWMRRGMAIPPEKLSIGFPKVSRGETRNSIHILNQQNDDFQVANNYGLADPEYNS